MFGERHALLVRENHVAQWRERKAGSWREEREGEEWVAACMAGCMKDANAKLDGVVRREDEGKREVVGRRIEWL